MKRFTRALFGALLLLTAFASTALAEWKLEPVKWSHPGLTSSQDGTTWAGLRGGFLRDTLYLPIAASKVDTTAEFSLMNCESPTASDMGKTSTTVDTLAGAYVIFQPDSAVASTITWGAATCAIQVNYGNGANWQTAYTYTLDPTAGQKQFVVPIYWVSTPANDTAPALGQVGAIFGPRVRAIFTGGTSAAGPSTRVFVKKFVGKGSVEHDAQNW